MNQKITDRSIHLSIISSQTSPVSQWMTIKINNDDTLSFIVSKCLTSVTCPMMFDVNIVQHRLPVDFYTSNIHKIVQKLLFDVHSRISVAILKYLSFMFLPIQYSSLGSSRSPSWSYYIFIRRTFTTPCGFSFISIICHW